MIRNYDENALLYSSEIALLLNLILSVYTFNFFTTLVIEFVSYHSPCAFLVM